MKKNFAALCLAALVTSFGTARSQEISTVPVMTTPVSAEANGMGGVSASVISNNALATMANPAQLGMFSLEKRFNASTYLASTGWSPSSATDNSLYAGAVNAGVNLKSFISLPIPVGLGVGFSTAQMKLPQFEMTPISGPAVTSLWHATQSVQNLTLAIGLDYWVKLGIGCNFKWVDSKLSTLDPSAQAISNAEGKAFAYDYGITVDLPVADVMAGLARREIKFGEAIFPVVNLTAAYVRRNMGDGIYYLEPAQTQPFPRQAVLGLSAVFGVKSQVEGRSWTLISFTWAREAEDNLVSVSQQPVTPVGLGDTINAFSNVFSYKGGLGDISPIDNLIFGRSNGNVDMHRGWQFQLAEFLYVRGGSSTSPGVTGYKTLGYALRLNGLVRILAVYKLVDIDHPGICSFIVDHVDLQYDYSEYTGNSSVTGTNFQALNLVIR